MSLRDHLKSLVHVFKLYSTPPSSERIIYSFKSFFLLAVGYSGSSSEDGLSKLQSNALTNGGGAP